MYIEVDVSEGPNCSWTLARLFKALTTPHPVREVIAPNPNGNDCLCQVTGWSASGPCEAKAVLVEDSGEGVSMLLYGGDAGLRLKALDNEEPWDLDSSLQWGEPCLLLNQDVELR